MTDPHTPPPSDAPDDRLDAVRRRRAAITPAPWTACHDGECPCGQVWSHSEDVIVSQPDYGGELSDKWISNTDVIKANATFIAAAPTDIDYLLDELTEARSAQAAAEEWAARLQEAFSELDQRLQVQSVPLVEVFNIIAAGGTPTEEQLRKAQHAYKWAVYGSSIAAQTMARSWDGDGSDSAGGEGV